MRERCRIDALLRPCYPDPVPGRSLNSPKKTSWIRSDPETAMPHRPFHTFSAATLLCLAVMLGACSSWQTESVAPAQLVTEEHPAKVLVGLTNGDNTVIQSPRVAGDSLTGTSGSKPMSVALADIRDISVLRPSPTSTAGLLLLVGATIFAMVQISKNYQQP